MVNHRHVWNIPEVIHNEDVDTDDDEMPLLDRQNAYQQDKPSELMWNVEVEEPRVQQLHRDDVDLDPIDKGLVTHKIQEDLHDINSKESDEEDDTLMDYCDSDEELESNETDNDMNVDTQVFYVNNLFKRFLKFIILCILISPLF